MRKYPRSAAAVQPSPSSAARRGSRWVEPTTKASTSHGADSRLTSVGQPRPQTWPAPRYWSPAPKATESSSATATVRLELTPTAVDQLDAVAVGIPSVSKRWVPWKVGRNDVRRIHQSQPPR